MEHTIELSLGAWRYDDEASLGTPGAFGGVYRGVGTRGEACAIKVFRPGNAGGEQREFDFVKTRLGKVGKNVITVYDYGYAGEGQAYIVMELANGTLRDDAARISQSASLVDAVSEVLLQIANGLIEAGDWVHRDLKPENVLKVVDSWKVSDFGIARQSDVSTALETMKDWNTPQYAAPEQWNGERTEHWTDVYALGCIGAELLAGRTLFEGSRLDLMKLHLDATPVIQVGTPSIRAMLHRMLLKHPGSRPSLKEVATELSAIRGATVATLSVSAARLTAIADRISEEKARLEAIAADAAARQKARERLADAAFAELVQITDDLFSHIEKHTRQARKIDGSTARTITTIRVSNGELELHKCRWPLVDEGSLKTSNWDMICGGSIAIKSRNFARSAGLWYAREDNGPYQWYETSFVLLNSDGSIARAPTFVPPDVEAGRALISNDRLWRVVHKPIPIGGSKTSAFVDRWGTFLADAAEELLAMPKIPEDA